MSTELNKEDLSATRSTGNKRAWLRGEGEVADLIRQLDWSKTPIGAPETWSPALRTTVELILASRFPHLLWWGPEYICIYNDAYRPILGGKHPWGLGKPMRECWAEVWDVLQPMIDTPFGGGPPSWVDDIELEIQRSGFAEESHFMFAYSPVPDETAPGEIGGVLATVIEITEKIVGERRLNILKELASCATGATTMEEACSKVANALSHHTRDIPFALLYTADATGDRARLAASCLVHADPQFAPAEISLADSPDEPCLWPLNEVKIIEQMRLVEGLPSLLASELSVTPHTAAVLPVRFNVVQQVSGFLVAGFSSRLKIDAAYKNFLELVASQIATALAGARAHEEERRRADALAAIDRAKTQFFSNVSHEFRTPLTLMLGPLERILGGAESLEPDVREQIEVAHRNSLRLLKLVNSLLDFSRIEAGRIKASYEPVDLSVLTAELASNFRSVIEAAGLTFTVDCPPLPEPVYVDRDMWEKVLLNLLSNAFKFTFEGGIAVRLTATADSAVLTVFDTGTGIPEAELPHIFERFHRIENARGRNFEGSGIGLALIQEYAKLHGGSVHVETELGKGSAFTVSVPFGRAHLPNDRIAAVDTSVSTAVRADAFTAEALTWLEQDLSQSSQTPATARARILLADDNADMREHIVRILGQSYHVTVVPDGVQVLRTAREQSPDLILSDIMMPGLDGFAMMQELRADTALREIPVILISARAGEEARTEGISAGADDYLTKPFSAKELLARVETTLENQRFRREARAAVETVSTRLQGALRAVGMVVWEWDYATGRVTYSPNAPEIIGLPVEHDIDRGLESIHPADAGILRALIQDAIRRRVPYVAQVRFTRPDNGVTLWMEAHGSVISENPLRLGGVFVDITNRHQLDEALRQSEERLSLAVEGAGMGMWDVDIETGRSEWSLRHYEMLGYPPAPDRMATMEMWRARVHPDDLAGVDLRIEQALSTGKYQSEHRIIRADNDEIRWLSEFGQFVRNEAGNPYRFVGVSFDVTERKRAELDLRRANQDLEQFAFSASHDLQEPLRTVKIFTELLRGRHAQIFDSESGQLIERIHDGAARMDTLLRDLLTYSRAGILDKPLAPQDANDAMQVALANLNQSIAESGARIDVGSLPSLPVHAAHLQQLFQNILGNAIKYRRPDVPPRIAVSAERQIGFWHFSITDNGIGVDPEFQEQIFGLFKRLHSREKYDGSGIGLALCRRIVEHYQGRIWLKSRPGEGSTFHFRLPV